MNAVRFGSRQPSGAWLALQPSIGWPFAWWFAVLGWAVVSLFSEPLTEAPCSITNPCESDPVFPVMLALLAISVLVFWWFPQAALLAGLGLAVLGSVADASRPSRWGAVGLGALAIAGLLRLRALRAQQARVAEEAAQTEPPPLRSAVQDSSDGGRRGAAERVVPTLLLIPALGVVGLVLALVSMVGYLHQTSVERAHLDRAVPAPARVLTHSDDDFRQELEVERGPAAGRRVSIEPVEELDRGTVVTVLLDPQDRSWARLVGEPEGHVGWLFWLALGAVGLTWAVAQAFARLRAVQSGTMPALHQVRCTRSGRTELVLAGSTQSMAALSLGSAAVHPCRGRALAPALVRGAVADGGWVSVTTGAGTQPVVARLRAKEGWRGLDAAAGGWVGGAVEVGRGLVFAAGQVGLFVLGCFLAWVAVVDTGPAWAAARGQGVPGQLTVTDKNCGGKGGCVHSGTFRSTNGRYTFTDVDLVGASGAVGSAVPALYQGDGEVPDFVYGPGWGALLENGFLLGMAAFAIGEPLLMLLLGSGRRRPGRRTPRGPPQDAS